MEVRGSIRKFLKVVEVYCSLLTLVEVMEVGGLLRKSTKFHKTCASRWKSIGVYGSSRKVPPNIAMEASDNRSFTFHQQRIFSSTSSVTRGPVGFRLFVSEIPHPMADAKAVYYAT